MYVCHFVEAPDVLYSATYDQTNTDLGVECRRIDKPLTGVGVNKSSWWWKIARILEEPIP